MISPEILRRYPFFAGLSFEHLARLANAGKEVTIDEGAYMFHEGDQLDAIYLLQEGAVGVIMEFPAADVKHPVSEQFSGKMSTDEALISAIGPGEVFAWSSLVPPHKASAGAKTLTRCRLVAFDSEKLLATFAEDFQLGYFMMQKVAHVISQRLHDVRIESLVLHVDNERPVPEPVA
ncbi:MAG: Crp/Fnr family transcriptional regulator [Caldilineales bacterium]|nr:Crp/Fnr family transcriptional regulator [Caldilineales bacterium]